MKTIALSLLLTAGFLSTIMGMEGMWGIAAPIDMLLTIVGNCVCLAQFLGVHLDGQKAEVVLNVDVCLIQFFTGNTGDFVDFVFHAEWDSALHVAVKVKIVVSHDVANCRPIHILGFGRSVVIKVHSEL